ncbi:MAG: MBL fold metallo-hydrolase, partial [Proteobacteria bacterium]|nr:MBL fold metallo-hydrolase [Pseudomonadota bacterium]
MGDLVLESLVVGPLQANCYILGNGESGEAVVIDPGDDGEAILALIQRMSWKVAAILNTHAHFDHTGGNAFLVRETGAPLMVPGVEASDLPHAHLAANLYGLETQPSPSADRLLYEGDEIPVGEEKIRVLSTPGHTAGGVTFLTSIGVFTGDALFAGSIGRSDLPGGNHDTLIASIMEKILTLPDE